MSISIKNEGEQEKRLSEFAILACALDANGNPVPIPASALEARPGALTLKGNIDASTNPNYPAAVNGDTYYVTVAGKVGGASGKIVEVGDAVICKADAATGNEAAVGASWFVVQKGAGEVVDEVARQALANLGDAASKNVGTTAGTVAAGDDERIVSPIDTTARADAAAAKNGFAPYNAGNITGNTTFNFSNGSRQKSALTGNVTLLAPTNGAEGNELRLRLTASGADRTLDFHAAILKPSDSAITLPKTLTSGKSYRVLLSHNGTAWELVSLVGGY
jgi:hypothetical protein